VSRDASIMAMDRFLREVASGDQSPHPARRVGDQGGDDAEDFESMRPTRNKAFGGAPRDQENTHTAALAALVSLRSCHADVRLLLRQCEDAAVVAQMASGLLTSDVAVGTRNNSSTINAAPGEASRQKSKKSCVDIFLFVLLSITANMRLVLFFDTASRCHPWTVCSIEL
jgi:hypothetical protein